MSNHTFLDEVANFSRLLFVLAFWLYSQPLNQWYIALSTPENLEENAPMKYAKKVHDYLICFRFTKCLLPLFVYQLPSRLVMNFLPMKFLLPKQIQNGKPGCHSILPAGRLCVRGLLIVDVWDLPLMMSRGKAYPCKGQNPFQLSRKAKSYLLQLLDLIN